MNQEVYLLVVLLATGDEILHVVTGTLEDAKAAADAFFASPDVAGTEVNLLA